MKANFILLITIWTGTLCAQSDQYMNAFKNFKANYNAQEYDKIFNEFSSGMQAYLPLENTTQFLAGLSAQAGKIIDKEFINVEGTRALYKTQFERALLGVHIVLDNNNKIDGLRIQPYEEPRIIEPATVNGLDNYPPYIADIIFSNTKDLPNKSQLSIAVIQNGKVNYYGIIRDDTVIKPVENQDKIFEIGSITKVFTSSVLASLVEDNKIKLTDDINYLFPFDFKDDTKITFESLANHTSGLPRLPENLDLTEDSDNPYINYGEDEIKEYLTTLLTLNNKSEKSNEYSNLGAGLLGYTLGISEGTTYQELLKHTVFDKYKMNNSFTTSKNLGDRLVKGIDKNSDTVSNWDFDVLFGGGGILSTTEDLVKFAHAQFEPTNRELELTRKPSFKMDSVMGIGLGWHILKSVKGVNLYWHNGGTGGYSSTMTINVKEKSGVIILSNVGDISKIIQNLETELLNRKFD